MKLRLCLALSLVGMIAATNSANADLVMTGSFQGWDPTTGVVMTDNGGGFFSTTLSGFTVGDQVALKILDDPENDGANWGDGEWTPNNFWFIADADGIVTVEIDTNLGGVGIQAANVLSDSANWTPQLVGDFMDEAGGAGDWNASDPTFNMNSLGGAVWTRTLTISTAGTYEAKLTDGTGWDRQYGEDGYSNSASTIFFTTTSDNQEVTFDFDGFAPSFSALTAIPEPGMLGVLMIGGMFGLVSRRRKA